MIAALGKNRVIGNNNKLLWTIPDDLKRFKKLTTEHSVIMGYNTYLSIGKPLPNRHNIVMLHKGKDITLKGADIAFSPEEALEIATGNEIFIIGGMQIYTLFLPLADKLYLTLIDDEKEGDTFFPEYNMFTKKTFEEHREHNGLHYTWINLERE